jgi:cellulose synthase/poly-beta-1,6-N-acetylglucosamine synthase-like glycosyltransferase
LARGIHKEIVFRHKHLMPDYPKAFGSYNFCAKRNVFNEVGGFNASYRNASGEDNDLSYKIIRAGHRIYFEREALVSHHHPESVTGYLKEQFRHGFWRVKMYQDHPAMAGGDGYTFWKDILEIPFSGVIFLCLLLSLFGVIAFKSVAYFLLLPFLLLQLVFAFFLTHVLFETFFYGFVIFFRAFARTLGFSTGIFMFFLKLNRKKSK